MGILDLFRGAKILQMGLALLCLTLSGAVHANETCDLDCSLTRMLAEEKLTGAVYGIVEGDSTRLGAVGLAHHATGKPMRADSKVHVGSVTKTLVALGVLRLVSEGRVDLDAPLSTLLANPKLSNPWADRSPVRLRHLLDHTSGLDDLHLWQIFSLRAPARAPLIDAFGGSPDLLRIRVEPGSTFSYSNMGYTLAAMAIEHITGERYEAWLDRELLRPLGMLDSTFEYISQEGPSADPRLAWGHNEDFSDSAAMPVWLRPATQFTTTAADMTRLARFMMGDGRLAEAPFIDGELLRQMGKQRGTLAAQAGLESGYALGLLARDRGGAVGLCHTGNIIGFRGALCLYPEQHKAFFIAHNTDSETAGFARFDELLTHSLGVSSPAVPAVDLQPPASWSGRYVLSPARFETLRYFDLLFDSVRLEVTAGGIELYRVGAEPLSLTPVGPRLFRARDRTQASHVLLESEDVPAISDGTRTYRRISAARFVLNWLSLGLGVTGLLMFLIVIPWRRVSAREPLLQPASLAWLLLIVPVPLFFLQPFTAIGDPTPASMSLYGATLALPLLMAAHLYWCWRNRQQIRWWRAHALAAVFVLQWCVVLQVWDMLPFASWA